MNIKIHRCQDSEIVVVCDKELIGKKFEEGDVMLNLTKEYYEGRDIDEKEASRIFYDANNITLIGEKSIGFALKLKIISKEDINHIQKIPFVMSVC